MGAGTATGRDQIILALQQMSAHGTGRLYENVRYHGEYWRVSGLAPPILELVLVEALQPCHRLHGHSQWSQGRDVASTPGRCGVDTVSWSNL
jgi:hypothetical protein